MATNSQAKMTLKERAHDLFIPIRRKQRGATGDSDNILAASTPLYSEPPKTPTRKQSRFDGSGTPTKTSTFIPSSGVHYTIPTTTKNNNPFNFIPKSSSPLKPETNKNDSASPSLEKARPARQDARHFRTVSSPVPRVTRQLSPTKVMPRTVQVYPSVDTTNLELHIAEEQLTRTAMPTPFPSPESQTVDMGSGSHSLYRGTSPDQVIPDALRTGRTRTSLKAGHLDPSIFRPHSRDSSRSSKDRSHPPSSFPAGLLEQIPDASIPIGPASKSLQDGFKDVPSKRSAKRYTILGLPSASSVSQVSPPRRRNSLGQYNEISSRAGQDDPIEQAEQARPLQDSTVHLRRTSQSGSRPSSRHSYSSSQNSVHDYSFHTTVHHFTTCSHTSPPQSRPLNEQPYLEASQTEPDIRPRTYRNVIRGSCFDCDTAARRGEETQVLLQLSPEISRLMNDLTYLVSVMEEINFSHQKAISPPRTPLGKNVTAVDRASPGRLSTLTRGTTGSASTGNTSNTNVFTDATSFTSESSHDRIEATEQQIMNLQQVIAQLSNQRDDEVNRIWRGYSARWGPGTLGVVQTKRPGSLSSRPMSRTGSNSRPVSMYETSNRGVYDMNDYGGENASLLSSDRHSPEKTSLSAYSRNDQESFRMEEEGTQNTTTTPQSHPNYNPAMPRSQSVRTGTGTSANSIRSALSHWRDRSRDSTPNTPFGGRSVARTETGISYSNADTPVGRMKVNWVRDES